MGGVIAMRSYWTIIKYFSVL